MLIAWRGQDRRAPNNLFAADRKAPTPGMRVRAVSVPCAPRRKARPQSGSLDPLRRQEGVPAGALPLAQAEQNARRDHRCVRQRRRTRNAGMGGALVPVRLHFHVLPRGLVAVVSWVANEADRDTELSPLGQSMLHESLGAIPGGEAGTRKGIVNSDAFAHGWWRSTLGELRVCPQRTAERIATFHAHDTRFPHTV